MYDYLVVGSGLYGAIFAHEAKAHGKSVLVVDKRPNIAGNIYTENIEGINVHKYGAHIFHIQHIMGISRASAYELVHTPGFPVVRSGRLIKISKKAFFNWLDSGGNSHENEKEKTA